MSTKIERNIDLLTPENLARLAIASGKISTNGKDGISYLVAAKKNGIVTALSPSYEIEILARLAVKNLREALEVVRKTRRAGD